jgi:hypothetical protein
LRHNPAKIQSDHNEYEIDYIFDVKVDNWPIRQGTYLQFLTYFVGYDVPEWMLLEQVDERRQLFVFLSYDDWEQFSQTQVYVPFKTRHHARDVKLNK